MKNLLIQIYSAAGVLIAIGLGIYMILNNEKLSRALMESDSAFNRVMNWKVQQGESSYAVTRVFILMVGMVFVFGGFLSLYRVFRPL